MGENKEGNKAKKIRTDLRTKQIHNKILRFSPKEKRITPLFVPSPKFKFLLR
jgi:hypothetical protein